MRLSLAHFLLVFSGALMLLARPTDVSGDEGMWLLNEPPRQLLKQKYEFDLSEVWLERAQKASVRFNSGGSGSFVSADGLIVTNHHIGADALQKLTTRERNLLRDGYKASRRGDELRCPDLELNVLQEIVDVTEKVQAAVKPDMAPDKAAAARRAVMSAIEKESQDKTGLRSDVVMLYQGGAYHLYRYKKYTDVRLVFAPEQQIAFFGGDTDNFEFPRYNLDVCFFRAYEDGKPAKVKHWFRWSKSGPRENDLVFVTGHPGTTNRLETLARLLYRRDIGHPYALARLRAQEAALRQFGEQGPEPARLAATDLHRVANARKAFAGQYQGLLDPAVLDRKRQEEKRLRDQFARDQKEGDADPWQQIAATQKKMAGLEKPLNLLERGDGLWSELFQVARLIVRLVEEKEKPNGDRLREYRDSNLESLQFQLFSPAPIPLELERAKLPLGLTFLAEQLGAEHPMVSQILAGKPPAARAGELLSGCRLGDVAERKRLVEGGKKAVEASSDPMIRLALLVDPEARRLRKEFETEVDEVEKQAYGRIAAVRFGLVGRTVAPDATFTLRLAFGVVKGYRVDGQELPFHTTFGGLYERSAKQNQREPFDLPERWVKGKDRVRLETPFNFVSTADTIGGNSGSPVLNRDGELVGINFDRNRHGLVRNFVYTEEQARHISVHSAAVLEALDKLYGAEELLRELAAR